MKFSGIVSIGKSDVHTQGQGHSSNFKVTGVKTNFAHVNAFPDDNSNSNQPMAVNSCIELNKA